MKNLLHAIGVAAVFAALPLELFAGSVDEIVAVDMAAQKIPGCSVAIVKDGHVVFAKGYGKANLELDSDATENTVYEIASLTKPFTAAAILVLVKGGALSLEDRLADLLEKCPPAWENITVRQLLNHTSGIKSYTSVAGFMKDAWHSRSPAEILAGVEKLPLDFAPGEGWDYSNTGYVVLGMVIERKSGKTYGEFLQEKLFRPLRMDATQFNDPRVVIHRRAAGYMLQKGKLVNRPHIEPSNAYAAGALISTVMDLARWEAALCTDALLPDNLRSAMWADPVKRRGMDNGYGFGWYVNNTDAKDTEVFHGGGIPGFRSRMSRYLRPRLSVIVLANGEHADVDAIAKKAAQLCLADNAASEPPRSPK